jgi:hypothetical protein
VAKFVDQYQVQHLLRKRILRRFRREGLRSRFQPGACEWRETPGDADELLARQGAARRPCVGGKRSRAVRAHRDG